MSLTKEYRGRLPEQFHLGSALKEFGFVLNCNLILMGDSFFSSGSESFPHTQCMCNF